MSHVHRDHQHCHSTAQFTKVGQRPDVVIYSVSLKCLCKLVQRVLRTVYGNSNGLKAKVGIHQGSALSPLLFVMVMELSREFRVPLPQELLYTDNLTVTAESEDDLIKRLNEWKDCLENRSMRVNMNKTKVSAE